MLVYKAMYKFLDQGVHAEVLDFPGAISWGPDLNEARPLGRSSSQLLRQPPVHGCDTLLSQLRH